MKIPFPTIPLPGKRLSSSRSKPDNASSVLHFSNSIFIPCHWAIAVQWRVRIVLRFFREFNPSAHEILSRAQQSVTQLDSITPCSSLTTPDLDPSSRPRELA